MFKIIVLVLLLATGQTGQLTYTAEYPTIEACEADKPNAERAFYKFIEDQFGLEPEDVTAEFHCVDMKPVDHTPAALPDPAPTTPVQNANNAYHVIYDGGGMIGTYIDKYVALRKAKGFVVVDGMCISACTLMIPILTREQVCVTPNARFAFHSATNQHGQYHAEATRLIWNWYPAWLRALLREKGWDAEDPLKAAHPELVYIEGDELLKIYDACSPAHLASL